MPYSDQQIQALMAAKPEDVQAVLGAMNPAQVKELTSAVTAFKANASGGWRDAGSPQASQASPSPQPPQSPGVLGQLANTAKFDAKNLKAGWDTAMGGLYGLGHDVAHAVGATSDKTYLDAINRVEQGQRDAQAQAQAGGIQAKVLQGIGQAAPAVMATVAGAPALGRVLGPTMAPIAAPAILGASTYATTPGTQNERINAGATTAALAPVIETGLNKVVAPLARGGINVVKGWFGKSATPDVADIASQFGKPVDQTAGGDLKKALIDQYGKDRAEAGAAFNALRANGGQVPLPTYQQSLDDALAKEINNRGGADPKIVSVLQRLKSGVENPSAPTDWGSALDVGSRLNGELLDAAHGATPNHELEKILLPIKTAHTADLDTAGAANGLAYQEAKRGWIDKVVPWEDKTEGAAFLKQFRNNPTPNDGMKALSVAGPDKANIFIARSNPEAKAAIQAGVADEAIKAGGDPITGEMDPKRILGAIKDREGFFNLGFTGEAKFKWDGFKNLMKNAYFVSKFIPGKLGTSSAEVAANLFTTKTGSDFLLGASNLNPTSKAFSNMVDSYASKVIGANAGAQAGPAVKAMVPPEQK